MRRNAVVLAAILLLSVFPVGVFAVERDSVPETDASPKIVEICHAYHEFGEIIHPGGADFYPESEDKPLIVMEVDYVDCENVPSGEYTDEDFLNPSD
jgi:hypothetical protein